MEVLRARGKIVKRILLIGLLVNFPVFGMEKLRQMGIEGAEETRGMLAQVEQLKRASQAELAKAQAAVKKMEEQKSAVDQIAALRRECQTWRGAAFELYKSQNRLQEQIDALEPALNRHIFYTQVLSVAAIAVPLLVYLAFKSGV